MYWRANDRRRAHELAAEFDACVEEGRNAANALLEGSDEGTPPFDQR